MIIEGKYEAMIITQYTSQSLSTRPGVAKVESMANRSIATLVRVFLGKRLENLAISDPADHIAVTV